MGQQLNALVAIVGLGIIAIVALITHPDDVTVTMACVTGMAGIAGTLQRGQFPSRSTDTSTNTTP